MAQTRYQPPTLQELLAMPASLHRSYTAGKNKAGNKENDQRLMFFDLFESINLETQDAFARPEFKRRLQNTTSVNITEANLKTALALFEMEIIRNEYGGADPIFKPGRFFNSGSTAFTDLKKEMKLSQINQISDEEIFVYFFKLHHYVKHYYPEQSYGKIWPDKEALLNSIEKMWQQVRKRQEDKITQLVNALPELAVLHARFTTLPAEYRAKAEQSWLKWFKSSKRTDQICFADFVNKACLNLKPENAHDILAGLLVFLYLDITSEYEFFSPGGILYEWLRPLNIDKCSLEDRIRYLEELISFLNKLKSHPRYTNDQMLTALGIHERIREIKCNLEAELKERPAAARYLATAVNYSAFYGINIVLASYLQEIALSGLAAVCGTGLTGALGTVVFTISSPVGVLMTGAAGTILLSRVAHAVAGDAIVGIVSGGLTWAVGGACAKLGDKTADMMMYALQSGKAGLNKLLAKDSPLRQEDKELLKEWLDSLLEAPESIVKEADKKQIKILFGLDGTLQPEPEPIVNPGTLAEVPVSRFRAS